VPERTRTVWLALASARTWSVGGCAGGGGVETGPDSDGAYWQIIGASNQIDFGP
jgi:hypothetical protein